MANEQGRAAHIINESWPTLRRWFETQRWVQGAGTDPAAIIAAMPWEDWIEDIGKVTEPLQDATEAAFKGTAKLAGIRAILDFDTVDDVTRRYAQSQGSRLISSITETQRQTVRTMVAESTTGRWTVDQLGRKLRSTVGLHPRWATAVSRYEDRQLMDLMESGKAPGDAAVLAEKRSERYRNRLLKRRGDNIARTEIQTASNLGKYASWETAVRQGYASNSSRKEFSPGPGACELCAPHSGEIVPWNEPFSNGKMMPPFHPSCRCTANMLPPDYDDDELDPQEFDWLDDSDAGVRPSFNSGLANRLSSVVREPSAPAASVTGAQLATAGVEPQDPDQTAMEQYGSIAQQAAPTKADRYTYANTLDMSDDELFEVMIEDNFEDPELQIKIESIIDERASRAAARAAEDAAIDAQIAQERADNEIQFGDYAAAQEQFAEATDHLIAPAGSTARKQTYGQRIQEEYAMYRDTQYQQAETETNGVLLNRAGQAKKMDAYDLFMGPVSTAKKYASEELLAWWEKNGRLSQRAYEYLVTGDEKHKFALDAVKAAGFMGEVYSGRDRSTF